MVGPDAGIRVFIALQISQVATQALAEVTARLSAAVPRGVRWVDPESVHLTLKFLGNIDPGLTGQVLEAVRRAGQGSFPFRLHLSGLGAFPNQRQPRVLWTGVAGDLDELAGLQGKMEDAIAQLGFPRDRRPFSPHLTIGRVRDRVSGELRRQIGDAVAAASLEPTDSWLVESVHLMRSTITPGGAVYASLGSARL